jgi:D-alanine-D-alanine ligase
MEFNMKRQDKIRVGIIFGGKSAEHEISLLSARSIAQALNKDKYETVFIGIDKSGCWYMSQNTQFLPEEQNPEKVQLTAFTERAVFLQGERELISLADNKKIKPLDVVFPVLHGPFGEDGTAQGLLKLADIPFVGASVLGSAIGMDKDVMKRLLRDAGIGIAPFQIMHKYGRNGLDFDALQKELGLPLFIKPANMGSSVGISRVFERNQFEPALAQAFKYDTKVLIEACIIGRELECSVLGNENPCASRVGEIIVQDGKFYSYEAKYLDEKGAILEYPASLPLEIEQAIQAVAVKTFQVLCCEGMARVDFFLTEKNEIIVNEINTIPGFTRISMYPKLWEVSGISYTDLLDRLIELALERYAREKELETTVRL